MQVWSWGDGEHGKLGLGHLDSEKQPQRITFLEEQRITKVHCGTNFTIALSATGDVFSWGEHINVLVTLTYFDNKLNR